MCPWKQNRNRKKILTFHTCLCFDMIHCAPINHQYWSWRRGDWVGVGHPTSSLGIILCYLWPIHNVICAVEREYQNEYNWPTTSCVQTVYRPTLCTTGCVTSGSTSTTFTGVVLCIYTGEHDFLNIIINSCLWDGSQQKKIFVMITLKYVRDVI